MNNGHRAWKYRKINNQGKITARKGPRVNGQSCRGKTFPELFFAVVSGSGTTGA
jgi:hypothetical protein